jgi:hypothetical protein
MIRRFETYAFLAGTSEAHRQELADVLLDAGRRIPEVLDNAVGWNRSGSPAELVWEHAYESVAAYQRYMVHRYHADMIDRYVLIDSPERVVDPLRGAGLFGYRCDGSPYRLAQGTRRVLLLRASPGVATADIAARLAVGTVADGGTLSCVGPDSMATAWFDGITPLPGPPARWTHVAEQGFAAGTEGPAPELGADVAVRAELLYDVISGD